jgi:hypothetical protein
MDAKVMGGREPDKVLPLGFVLSREMARMPGGGSCSMYKLYRE